MPKGSKEMVSAAQRKIPKHKLLDFWGEDAFVSNLDCNGFLRFIVMLPFVGEF
jgi:hypothetical protein